MAKQKPEGPAWLHAAFLSSTLQEMLTQAMPFLADMFQKHGVSIHGAKVETGWDTPTKDVHLAIRLSISFNNHKGVLEHKIPSENFGDNSCVRDAIQVLVKEKLPEYVRQHLNG